MKNVFLWLIIVSMIGIFCLVGCKSEVTEKGTIEVFEKEEAEPSEEVTGEEVEEVVGEEVTEEAPITTQTFNITAVSNDGTSFEILDVYIVRCTSTGYYYLRPETKNNKPG